MIRVSGVISMSAAALSLKSSSFPAIRACGSGNARPHLHQTIMLVWSTKQLREVMVTGSCRFRRNYTLFMAAQFMKRRLRTGENLTMAIPIAVNLRGALLML